MSYELWVFSDRLTASTACYRPYRRTALPPYRPTVRSLRFAASSSSSSFVRPSNTL